MSTGWEGHAAKDSHVECAGLADDAFMIKARPATSSEKKQKGPDHRWAGYGWRGVFGRQRSRRLLLHAVLLQVLIHVNLGMVFPEQIDDRLDLSLLFL